MKQIMALLAFMSVLSAINLSDRNFYTDEVVLTNPCLQANGIQFPYSIECQGQGILKTDYGSTIAENLTIYTNDSQGRINGVLQSEFKDVPKVKAKGYQFANATNYALRVASVIDDKFQYAFLVPKANCISFEAKEIIATTDNLIKGIHFIFPYIHVEKTDTGWCFVEP